MDIYLERFLWLFELKLWNVVVRIDIIVIVHKEWDWDLAFAFLATDLGSVSTLVTLRNSLGNLQNSDIAFRNEFNTIALFQALKCFELISISMFSAGVVSLKFGFSVSLCVSSMAWRMARPLKTLEGSRARASSWLQGYWFIISFLILLKFLLLWEWDIWISNLAFMQRD